MDQSFELQYAVDTFYFLICGALVMWMAAGFAMLEAGLVRAKNTAEILTKNVALFSISCVMYLVCGYAIMYGGEIFLAGIGDVDPDAVLADFADFVACQEDVDVLYRQPDEWARRAILNIANMGKFSSDRTIGEYADLIWKATAVHHE